MYSARDIRNLESQLKKRALGGYDADSVKAHLTALAQQWELMEDARRGAEDKVREMEDKLKHYEKVELALQEALETARDTARRTEESADRKARLIVEEAELRAQRIIQEAEQERYGLRQDLNHLTNKQAEVAARLRSFLMSELEMLAQFQGEDPVGFIKLIAPERSASERTLPPPPVELPGDASADAFDEAFEERYEDDPEFEDASSFEPSVEPDASVEEGAPEEDERFDGRNEEDVRHEEPESQPEEASDPVRFASSEVDAPAEDASAPFDEPSPAEAPPSFDASEPVSEHEEAAPADSEGFYVSEDAQELSDPSLLSDADLSDEERAGFTQEREEVEKPKPIIPRSPWPDVDASSRPHSVWPPVPQTREGEAEGADPGSASDPAPPQPARAADPSESAQPPAAPSWSSPGVFSSADEDVLPPAAESEGGWSLRSLVTGEESSEGDKDKHREAVRRIMEDMD